MDILYTTELQYHYRIAENFWGRKPPWFDGEISWIKLLWIAVQIVPTHKIFVEKTFVVGSETVKFAKVVFSLESIPLYGILSVFDFS